MRIYFGARPWAVVVGLLLVGGTTLGTYLAKRPPAPPEACRDAITITDCCTHECSHPDAVLSVEPGPGVYRTVRCTCPRRPVP